MAAELNDQEVALMTDIAQNAPIKMTAEKRSAIDRLSDEGFIAQARSMGASAEFNYKLTAKGQKALDDLGVGANES